MDSEILTTKKEVHSAKYGVDDIELTKRQYDAILGIESEDSINKRTATSDLAARWPTISGKPTVFYELLPSIDPVSKRLIHEAISEYENKTCLKFVTAKSGSRVKFTSGCTGCYSSIGNRWNSTHGQDLCLGWCKHDPSLVRHEMGHAIGLWHEQQRPDSGSFIKVIPSLKPGDNYYVSWARNFRPVKEIETYGVPYDYHSIMHYPALTGNYAWGNTEIKPLDKNEEIRGQQKLTDLDIELINRMYSCPSAWGKSFAPSLVQNYTM